MEPDGQTPFVVARGDVVWVNVEPNGIVIHRRRLGARADARRDERRPMAGRSLAAPATSANWATSVNLLKLVGDELFFTAGDAIGACRSTGESPRASGFGPGTTPASAADVVDLVAHGACAYFVVDDTIRRARMDGGAGSELVVAAD